MDHTWTAVFCVTLAFLSGAESVRLLIGRMYGTIHLYDTETQESQVLVNASGCSVVDYHYSKGYIYYSNEESIKRHTIDPKINGSKTLALDSHVRGIAVDWINDNVYWTRSYEAILVKADLDGNNQTEIVTQNNISQVEGLSDVNNLHSIVVDPYERSLFMIAGNGTSWMAGTLIRSDLEGRGLRMILLNKYNIINGFTIDMQDKKLYVYKRKPNTLYSIDYNGVLIEEFFVCPDIVWIFPFAMFRRSIYMAYMLTKNFKADALQVESLPSVKCPNVALDSDKFMDYGRIFDIVVYDVEIQQPLGLYNARQCIKKRISDVEKCLLLTTERGAIDCSQMAPWESCYPKDPEITTSASTATIYSSGVFILILIVNYLFN